MSEKLISEWTPIKNGRGKIVGYLEKFKTNCGVVVSLPGVSRWIEGAEFNPSLAMVIE